MSELTSPVAATMLASLDGMGPRRLAALLQTSDPVAVIDHIKNGRVQTRIAPVDMSQLWAKSLIAMAPESFAAALATSAITVTTSHDDDHPELLRNDIDPCPVLFRRGAPVPQGGPAVAIIGTRRCSGVGRELAYELGAELAAAHVTVVSGLALGIDGAAHQGALEAGGAAPLAVVGSGADVVYPKRHQALWAKMIDEGTLLTEVPPGGAPLAWRFPARNRMLAALADVIVVVESRGAGGSLLTVDQAIRRGREVMAVPGSLRNPAAEGANNLLADGCAPVRNVDDILAVLGLGTIDASTRREQPAAGPEGEAGQVFGALDDGPTSPDQVAVRTGLPAAAVFAQLELLISAGWVATDGTKFLPARRSASAAIAKGGGSCTPGE